MWRLTRYALAFAAGQAFQFAVERKRDVDEIYAVGEYFSERIREAKDNLRRGFPR